MRIEVKLFAVGRQLAGCESIVVELPAGATVGQLRGALAVECAALAALLDSAVFAVDQTYADDQTQIPAGAEVACIPPVSGG